MGSIQLLLGKSRWRRRRALPHEHLSGVTARGMPTFLYVTDTQRKKAVVEREFLAHRRERPVFTPRVRVLSEVFTDLHQRHGPGAALLPPEAEALVAAGVLDEASGAWPWLGALGGSVVVGESLARLNRLLHEARRSPETLQVPHRDELVVALTRLRARLAGIPGFVTRARSLEHLLQVLQAPPPALVQWLRSTHSVVIDDVLQASPLRVEALVALCRAWEAAGTHVVVAFETGRDLGGREVEAFFEYGDVDDVAFPLKPFQATRALRRALFDAVVAEGSGGQILLARAASVVPIEPFSTPEPEEAPDLADWVYASGPVPVDTREAARALLRDRVRLVRCEDPLEELVFVAREVKQALLRGEPPDACVVALPDLAHYAPAVRAVFADHGVPVALTAGSRLAHSPVTNLVRRLLRVALDGWRPDDVLAIARSDLVERPLGTDATALRLACRAAGVVGGHPAGWAPALMEWLERTGRRDALARSVEPTLGWILGWCDALSAVAVDAPPDAWWGAALAALDALGVPRRVGRARDAALAAENLHAWGAILEVIEHQVRVASIVGAGEATARALIEQVDRALQQGVYRADPLGEGRVQVVGALELRGLSPRHTWLCGLHRGAFPARRAGPFLVPFAVERALDPIDPLAEARYLLGSLLRNTLDASHETSLVVSWPATVDGRPVGTSPVLADLLDRPTELGPLLGDLLVDAAPRGDRVLARSDVLRAAARDPDGWGALVGGGDLTLVGAQREAAASRRAPSPGRWEGVVGGAFPVDRPVSVTRLEGYLRCPAAHAYRTHLGLEVVEEWSPELDRLRGGVAIHAILDRFLRARSYASLRACPDREGAARALHAVAVEVFDEVAAQGGFESALLREQRRVWLAGLVDDAPAGVLRAWLDLEVDEVLPLDPSATEVRLAPLSLGPVEVHGTLDRLDRVQGGGLLVTDYKTGAAPSRAAVERGLALQPVLYAALVARDNPGTPVGAVYQSLKRPDAIRRVGWVVEPALEHLKGRSSAVVLDEPTRERLLHHARDGARRMVGGVFHATLAEPDEVGCVYCPFRRVCRWRGDRAADLRDAAGDLMRPLEGGCD